MSVFEATLTAEVADHAALSYPLSPDQFAFSAPVFCQLFRNTIGLTPWDIHLFFFILLLNLRLYSEDQLGNT